LLSPPHILWGLHAETQPRRRNLRDYAARKAVNLCGALTADPWFCMQPTSMRHRTRTHSASPEGGSWTWEARIRDTHGSLTATRPAHGASPSTPRPGRPHGAGLPTVFFSHSLAQLNQLATALGQAPGALQRR
jgi:hypothetical protein